MLSPGHRLGPYEVDVLLGAGGMGEVYRARDVRLDRTVAIKVLSTRLKSDEEFRDRFEREARAVAGLNHPHICTLHDVGREDGVDYLVMEFMEGQTLTDLLASRPLGIEEWLRLAIQITSALDAAHEQHVVHRDIKPGNIFVTTRGHAKVLDFGLAKQIFPASQSSLIATVAATGVMAGTIQYMSPEQARGRDLDHRSDLFSLGVVLYEMATQRHPFHGEDIIETLDRIANRQPSPIAKGMGVWAEVDRVVDRCLKKDPAERYGSAAELHADLTRIERALQSGTMDVAQLMAGRQPGNARVRRWLEAAGLVAVLAGAALTWWSWRPAAPSSQPSTDTAAQSPGPGVVRPRRAIAVMGIQNLSGRDDDAWLATALEEMLAGELGINEALRVVAGQNVARVRRELELADGSTLDRDTLVKLRSSLGADLVVVGSYLAVPSGGGQLRVMLNVQDASAGETVTTLSETGTTEGVLQLVSNLGDRLRGQLGIEGPAADTVDSIPTRLTTNRQALRLYAEGLAHLRNQEFVLARDALTKAIAADPQNAQIRVAMADAWSALGYDQRAEEEADRAADRAQVLSREDRLWVEGRQHEMARRWDEAIDRYRTLFGFFPDNVDYGVSLAGVLTQAGRPAEALSTVSTLRTLPSPSRDDVRIELAEAEAAHAASDFERELAAGEAAAERGLRQGTRLLVAQGRLAQAQAQLRLGRRADAARLVESARQLFVAGGDRSGEARALNRIANIAYEQGDFAQARRLFQDAERALRAVGNLRDLAIALNNVADTMMMQDDLGSAAPVFAEALEVTRERGDRAFEGFVLLNLADLAHRQGDLATAESTGVAGLALARAGGNSYAVYMGLLALGNVALAKQDLRAATTFFEEGLALARRSADQRYMAYLLAGLGNVAQADGRVKEARTRHEESLAIRTALRADAEAAESRLALALLAIQEGQPERVLVDVTAAAQTLGMLRLPASEAYAWTVVALASALAGRGADAARAVAAAEPLRPSVQTVSRRLAMTGHLARVDATGGQLERARVSLRNARDEANRRGFASIAREAQRALDDLRGGGPQDGPAR